MHERTQEGRAFRLLTILDEYSRECCSIDAPRQMNHQDVLERTRRNLQVDGESR